MNPTGHAPTTTTAVGGPPAPAPPSGPAEAPPASSPVPVVPPSEVSGVVASTATPAPPTPATPTPSTPTRRSPRLHQASGSPPVPRVAAVLLRAPSVSGVTRVTASPMLPAAPTRHSPRLQEATSAGPDIVQVLREEAAQRSTGMRTRGKTTAIKAERTQKRPRLSLEGPHHADGASVSKSSNTHDGDDDGADDSDEDADQDVDSGDEASDMSDGSADTASSNGQTTVHRAVSVQVLKKPLRVPAPQLVHDDWEAWFKYLATYQEAHHHLCVIKNTLSLEGKNKLRADLVNPLPPLPKCLGDPFHRCYICTHGWAPSSRGTGKRPKRFVRGIDCPFRFRVQWEERNSVWCIVVTPTCMLHNHPLDDENFATYPSERKPKISQENIEHAHQMTDWGVPRAQVYDMFLDRGENVYQKDVDNIVSSHRARAQVKDDDEATAKIIADFSAANDGGLITVDETEGGETGVVSITTRHMREMYERFAELILVDCTRKTNKNNYQLCTVMVMDEYGHGQVVQQSLFERNADWHMERALDHLEKANTDYWDIVRVIMVDKDLHEIRVLKARFPLARILICLFHVIKYLTTASLKIEYGKLSKDDHDTLDTLFSNTVYSSSRGAYESNRFALQKFCTKAQFTSFFEYFMNNWDSCTDMWVLYERQDLPHFRNHTNNRVESYFGKFKQGVDAKSTMADCITQLIKEARRSANQRIFDTRVGRSWNANYDEEMNNVLMVSTHYVASFIAPEYARAIEMAAEYTYELPNGEDGQYAVVKTANGSHEVDLTDWSCDCAFAKTMRLPCRHAMAYRRARTGTATIPLQRIDARWSHATRALPALNRFAIRRHSGVKRVPPPIVSVAAGPSDRRATTKRPTPGADLASASARFGEAMRLVTPICSEIADVEDREQFKEFCDFLLEQWRVIRQRLPAAVKLLQSPVFRRVPPLMTPLLTSHRRTVSSLLRLGTLKL